MLLCQCHALLTISAKLSFCGFHPSTLVANDASATALNEASLVRSDSLPSTSNFNVEISESILASNELSCTNLDDDSPSILVFKDISPNELTFSIDETLVVNDVDAEPIFVVF